MRRNKDQSERDLPYEGMRLCFKRKPRKPVSKIKSEAQGLRGERGTKRLIIVFDEAMSAECESAEPSVLLSRSEAEAIGDDTRTDGKEPAEPRRGSWRVDAPIRSKTKSRPQGQCH